MRWWFVQAADRYGESHFARLLPDVLWAVLWLAVLLCAIHALRRWRRQPHAPRLARYLTNQRLYHWGNAALIVVLAVSGVVLFVRRPMLELPVSWLAAHEWSGLAFALMTVFHAVIASTRGDGRSMWFTTADGSHLSRIAANFLGRTGDYPQPGKYDVLQKIYHALLALLSVGLIASGVVMWLSAARVAFGPRALVQWSRIAHDISATGLLGALLGHIYFSILKVNRQNLRDMVGLRVEEEPARVAAPLRMAADD